MMLAASYGTVGDIEILFTGVALVGFLFSALNIKDAVDDVQALTRAGLVNGRMPIAQTAVRVEFARLTIQAVFILIGALAMTIPESVDELDRPWNVVALGITFRWGLILAGALVMFQAIENRRLRQYLRSLERPPKGEGHEGKPVA